MTIDRIFTNISVAAVILLAFAQLVFAQQQAVPVFVSEATTVEFVDEVEALGTLQANENVNLASSVTERITQINFSDNQRVRKGDVLVKMEDAEQRAQLAEQEIRMREAERQYKRAQKLVERGVTTETEADERRLEYETAKVRVEALAYRIEERKVVAPFDGVVGIRNISVGALAQPGTVMVTIDDDSVMKLDFSVPEIFLASLAPGIRVEAKASAYPNRLFEGTVTSIDSRVDPTTRAVAARAILDNGERLLKAGMLITLVLNKNPRQALVIPEEALVPIATRNYVYVAREKDGKTIADRIEVRTGSRQAGEIEIIAGIKDGDKVITHGTNRVRPGSEITIRAVETGNETLEELLGQQPNGRT